MGNDSAAWAALPPRLRWLTAGAVAAAAVRLAFGTTPAASVVDDGLVLRPAAGVVDQRHLQGAAAADRRRLDDEPLLRRGLRGAAPRRTGPRVRRRRAQHVEPDDVPGPPPQPAAPGALQHGRGRARDGRRRTGLPWPRRRARRDAAGLRAGRRRRGRRLLHRHDVAHRPGRGLVAQRLAAGGVARRLPVDGAGLRRRRGRRGRLRVGARPRQRDRAAARRRGAGAADLSQLPRLLRAPGRRAAAGARGVGPAPGDGRGPGRRHRRQGQRLHAARAPRRAARRTPGPDARHERERGPRRQDRRAAARHRQAGGAGVHPLEAGPAHRRGVRPRPGASARRRRDHLERAVPVPGRAAGPLAPRALGRVRLSRRPRRRGHPARRAGHQRRRLLRRPHLRSPVSTRRAGSGRAGHAPGRGRPRARSARRRRLHQR